MSLIKYIEFVLELQGDSPMVMCSIFKRPFIVHNDNQGEIALTVATQIWACIKHITIKYHHFCNFMENGDVEIQHPGYFYKASILLVVRKSRIQDQQLVY